MLEKMGSFQKILTSHFCHAVRNGIFDIRKSKKGDETQFIWYNGNQSGIPKHGF